MVLIKEVEKLLCPYCSSSETKVVDKRSSPDLKSIRRRRECLKCSKRFTTRESIASFELNVIKKDGSVEMFSREKLLRGITLACEKRPVNNDEIIKLVDYIETKIRSYKKTNIPSKLIGELVIKKLMKLDQVAYVRFASIYKGFEDVDDFKKEISVLVRG